MSDDAFKSREKTRLCPSCRMSISTLATKCRFCGENVGRPKDETRQLSISDLGGETIVHYAPSSNVMEALEAFRVEETTVKTPEPRKRTTIFGRKGPDPSAPSAVKTGLPELDERSKALASLTMPMRSSAAPRSHGPSWIKKTAVFGAFVALLIILYFGTLQGWAMIQGLMADEAAPVWVNGAPAVIDSGGNPVDALRMAAEALRHDNSVANREIMERARKYFSDRVYEILNSPRITLHDLREASNLANAGWQAAPGQAVQALRDEVDRESMAYGMHVISIDKKQNKATLQLFNGEQVEVKPDATFSNGRFRVQSVTESFVRVIDNERTTPTGTKRQVLVNTGGIPK